MASKPSDTLNWVATGQTVDPGAIRTSGWLPGNRGAAQHFNFILKLITDWIAYIDDQVFTGDFTADRVITTDSDIVHSLRTTVIGPFDFVDTLATGTRGGTGTHGGSFTVASGTFGEFYVPIRLDISQRLKEIRVIAETDNGATTDITARISKTVANVGDAAGTQSYLSAAVNLPSVGNDVQAIALTTGLPDTVQAGECFEVRVNIANTGGGAKYVYRVEVDVDRV